MNELALLLAALAKVAIQEGLFWSQGKTKEQMREFRLQTEAKTEDLIDRMRSEE